MRRGSSAALPCRQSILRDRAPFARTVFKRTQNGPERGRKDVLLVGNLGLCRGCRGRIAAGRGSRGRNVVAAELVEHAAAARLALRRRHAIENVERLRAVAGDDGERQRGGEEGDRQDRRRARQRIGSAARGSDARPSEG